MGRSRLEMSITTTILAVALYPLLSSLPLNPVRFRWGFSQGLAPMPPEVQERAEAGDRTVLLLIYVTLLMVGALLLHGSSISRGYSREPKCKQLEIGDSAGHI